MAEVKSGVYFIQAGDSGPIKIGFSDDVDRRIASLQTGNPEVLRLLLVVPGTMETEAELHKRFAAARIRESGEWFRTTRQLMEFVGRDVADKDEEGERSKYTQAEYRLQDCMIAWNPVRAWVKESPSVQVGPLSDNEIHPSFHWSSAFVMWDRAGRWVDGLGAAHEWSLDRCKEWLYMKWIHLVVRDGVPAADVHREFLKIEEYRDGLSDDVPGIGTPLPENTHE